MCACGPKCRLTLATGGCALAWVEKHPDGDTRIAVAEALGCTPQAVEQSEMRALRKLAAIMLKSKLTDLAENPTHARATASAIVAETRAFLDKRNAAWRRQYAARKSNSDANSFSTSPQVAEACAAE